jgi:hypothetical protein
MSRQRRNGIACAGEVPRRAGMSSADTATAREVRGAAPAGPALRPPCVSQMLDERANHESTC